MPDPLRDAAQALLDALRYDYRHLMEAPLKSRARRQFTTLYAAHGYISDQVDALRAALAAADTGSESPKRWTFDVQGEDASIQTDYGTGIEHRAAFHWAIYDGPSEIDDYVLAGYAEDVDPTAALVAICAEHNRAAADGTTPTQPDEVLYDGPTGPLYQRDTPVAWRIEESSSIPVAPGTRVRVVATPATEGTQ